MSSNQDLGSQPKTPAASTARPIPLTELPIGSLWKHKRGDVYRIVALANGEGTRPEYPTTIVYRNIRTRMVYCRPHSRFTPESFEEVPGFTTLED